MDMGDSDLPPHHDSRRLEQRGSATNVVVKACEELRRRIAEAAVKASDSPFHGADPATLALSDGKLIGPDRQARTAAQGGDASRTSVGGVCRKHPNGPALDCHSRHESG